MYSTLTKMVVFVTAINAVTTLPENHGSIIGDTNGERKRNRSK